MTRFFVIIDFDRFHKSRFDLYQFHSKHIDRVRLVSISIDNIGEEKLPLFVCVCSINPEV